MGKLQLEGQDEGILEPSLLWVCLRRTDRYTEVSILGKVRLFNSLTAGAKWLAQCHTL